MPVPTLQAACLARLTVLVTFSEAVQDLPSLTDLANYTITPLTKVNAVSVLSPTQVQLTCDEFMSGRNYSLHVAADTARAVDADAPNAVVDLLFTGIGPQAVGGSFFNTGFN